MPNATALLGEQTLARTGLALDGEELLRRDRALDQVEDALTVVRLDESDDFLRPQERYVGFWRLVFVHPGWYGYGENRKKLCHVFPAFVVVKVLRPPFTDPPEALAALFAQRLLLLPIKRLDGKAHAWSRLTFAGASFPQRERNRRSVAFSPDQFLLVDVCLFGTWISGPAAQHALVTSSLAGLVGLDREVNAFNTGRSLRNRAGQSTSRPLKAAYLQALAAISERLGTLFAPEQALAEDLHQVAGELAREDQA